jgi:glycosyltransferase involved in cell wall biosynthesis
LNRIPPFHPVVSQTMRLSIVIPVYDERETLGLVLVCVASALPTVEKEIVIVDDFSKDGTREWLKANFTTGERTASAIKLDGFGNLIFETQAGCANITIRPIYHDRNRGKGGGIQSGLAAVTGDVVVIQDADLEYDPNDWEVMYNLIAVKKVADVVYGTRFFGRPHRSLYFHHYMANRTISFIFNLLYNQTLSDIEVCYKMFTRAVRDSLKITCNDFGCEVQISAQICRARKWRIYEAAIHYYGRTYSEGKKINWKDGFLAFWYLAKFRVMR